MNGKSKWCPLIKDYCKGSLCICYEEWTEDNGKMNAYCKHLAISIPVDKPEDNPDEA